MRVPTANVIVGFDREVMDRFFTEGATYKSLIQGLTKEGELDNVLLFNNESNPNFISFEHNLINEKFQMFLTFIDPKGEFERRFLTDSIPRTIAGFSHNTEVYNKFTYEKQAPSQEDVISKKASEETKQSQKLYDNKFFADLQKDLIKFYGERYFYVAYGSGDNLDLWSGPHLTLLTNADISVKGARKITLELVPTSNPVLLSHRRGAYNEEVNLNLAGLTMRYSGISKPIEFTNILNDKKLWFPEKAYDPLKYLDLIGSDDINSIKANRENISGALDKIGLKEAASELGEFDFHSILVDALRSYVQKATGNPNVIILLPNINVTCRQHINDSIQNLADRQSKVGQYIHKEGSYFDMSQNPVSWDGDDLDDPAFPGDTWNFAAWYPSPASGLSGPLAEPTIMPLAGSHLTEVVEDLYNPLLGELGYKELFMSTFLNSFGLGLHQVLKKYSSHNYLKAIPSHTTASKQHYERATTADKRFEEYFNVHNFYAIVQKASNEGIPDHRKVIKTIIDNINRNAKEDYQINWTVYNETDIKLLDFWGGSIKDLPIYKFPTFGGYKYFNEKKEAIIVGDRALIQQYLYGKVDLDAKFKNIQEYEDFASLAKENQSKYEKQADALVTSWEVEQVEAFDAAAAAEAENYKEGIIGAIKAIPLHPLDAIILTNKSYNKAVRDIMLPPITSREGSFGNISDVPDTFGYSDKEFTKDELDYIKKQAIPIFRYNTENPNILDIDFKFPSVYLAALKMGFTTAVKRKASAVVEGVLPIGIGSLPIRTHGAAVAYLRQKNYSLGLSKTDREEIKASLKGKISIELIASLEATDPSQAADAIASIIERAEQGDDADLKGLIYVDQLLPGNPQSIMTDFVEDMYRNSVSISIKTLPLFHVSKWHYLSSPCIVFAQDAPIKQSVDTERTLLNSFFSGIYKIMGYKHTINTTTATSEFILVKNQANYSTKKEETTEWTRLFH